jgi:hypothetical protein
MGEVGMMEKKSVGTVDGATLGATEGTSLGATDGALLGTSDGTDEGIVEGAPLGMLLGASDTVASGKILESSSDLLRRVAATGRTMKPIKARTAIDKTMVGR